MHRKGHKASRKRTMRKHKGGYYAMSGSIAPGAALYTRGSEMGDWAVSNRGGNAQYGSGKRKTRRRRGGMLFCQPDMSAPDPKTGKCKDGSDPLSDTPGGEAMAMGGKRRRTMKKGKKGSRKQRGGNKFGAVSASYVGTGSRGLANVVPVDTKGSSGSAAGGAFNNFGAQPGSGYGSFIKAH